MASAKLATYRAKRDFSRTAEPSGDHEVRAGHSFVIQKHAARRLHYDFRLELDGVLLSWSVPKGPSLAPKERRLAVRTEDHPLDYAGFEGIIPKGQYGGGTVVVWDRGSWDPEGDPRAGMTAGKLTFTLHGEKLHGRWHLVRTKPQGKQETWILFKGRDDAADDKRDIVEDSPASVVSGRTIDEVAANPERTWTSDRAMPSHDVGTALAQLGLGVELTNLDKVLYPDDHITKGQLLAYLAVVSERMLPHVANRPLMLVRCPNGIGKPCWHQKHEKGDASDASITVRDMRGLVALAQLGSLEIHTWGSRAPDLEHPDVMVLDLDPDDSLPWKEVALAAFDVRTRLRAVGLDSLVKTTGGKGLHVVVPLSGKPTWDEVKAWTKAFAEQLERDDPKTYSSTMGKANRKGRIYVDYVRNSRGATFIAPYSPRARKGAPISTPIDWEELARGVDPAAFTMAAVTARTVDPWASYRDVMARNSLPGRHDDHPADDEGREDVHRRRQPRARRPAHVGARRGRAARRR